MVTPEVWLPLSRRDLAAGSALQWRFDADLAGMCSVAEFFPWWPACSEPRCVCGEEAHQLTILTAPTVRVSPHPPVLQVLKHLTTYTPPTEAAAAAGKRVDSAALAEGPHPVSAASYYASIVRTVRPDGQAATIQPMLFVEEFLGIKLLKPEFYLIGLARAVKVLLQQIESQQSRQSQQAEQSQQEAVRPEERISTIKAHAKH